MSAFGNPWSVLAQVSPQTLPMARRIRPDAGCGPGRGPDRIGGRMGRLDDLDLSLNLSKQEEADRLKAAQTRLLALRLTFGGLIGNQGIGPGVCVVFEGWDAAGKGGCIKRLVARLDPRHVRVAQFAAPTYD